MFRIFHTPMRFIAFVAVAVTFGVLAGCAPDQPPAQAALVQLGDQSQRVVTLTFDCGSDSGSTSAILDLLHSRGITAAFGVTGQFAATYPALVQRMAREGHQVMNHSYTHRRFTDLSSSERATELARAEQTFNKLGVSSAGWFRPPEGATDAGVEADLAKAGYYLDVKWTIDSKGWMTNPRSTVQTVLNAIFASGQLRNGAIILMHVGELSVDYAALPSVLWGLKARGYGFASPAQALTSGVIGKHYDAIGAQRSVIGVPQTVERSVPKGRWQLFRGGRMYWSSSTGAWEVHGAILGTYTSRDSTDSRLGFPVSDEYSVPGGRRSDFQHGFITWSAATRTTTVTYR